MAFNPIAALGSGILWGSAGSHRFDAGPSKEDTAMQITEKARVRLAEAIATTKESRIRVHVGRG